MLFAHVLIPERSPEHEMSEPPRIYGGTMDAITRGTSDGLEIFLTQKRGCESAIRAARSSSVSQSDIKGHTLTQFYLIPYHESSPDSPNIY